jgi:CRP-like cAMP-binding protein
MRAVVACPDWQELFEAAEEFSVPPNTVIFRQGDDSSSGIYIVVEGSLAGGSSGDLNPRPP